MKRLVMVTLLLAAGMAMTSVGYAGDKPLTPQQQRMKDCNAEAASKNLTGQPRKDFMKTCLGTKPDTSQAKKPTPQQEKMKSCNAEATSKSLTGQARKDFMKTCLSN